NAQQKSAALTTLFGAEAFKHWQILMNRGSTDLENMTQALRDSGGTAEEVANKQLDNLNGQLTLLKSAFEGASISLGSALLPALSAITSVVQQAVDWFNGLNEKTKSMIAIISALGAGLLIFGGLFLMIVGAIPSMVIGFGMLGTALSALGGVFSAILSPIGLVIAAIAGIGIGLKAAYENVEWFRNGVDTAFAFIKDSISLAIKFINEQLTKLREFWSENSDSILSKAQEIWTAILNVINEVLSTVWGFIQDILGKIQEFWQNHGDFITNIASTVWGAIKSVIEGTLSSIKDNIESALGIIKGIFEAVWPIISGVVTIAWGLIKTTVQNSIDFVYGIIDTVMNLLKGDWEGAWESIKETAESIWNNIEKFFEDVDLVEIGKNIIRGLIKGIGSMTREVRETVESIASGISNAVTGFFDIHSPSRLTRGQGRNIGKGLELGLADSLNGLIKM
ncbi:phage tail tape measure protein, partial [Streptomyces sp. NPDC056697]|uniref:phage tail tape measure protein n=1 Tax=Streptomyces sp. NPDC056697 TaxID=3345915 RepID=UPI0036B3BBBA